MGSTTEQEEQQRAAVRAIKFAADRLLARGHLEIPELSRDARRNLVRMTKELTQLWRSGKPVQRRQNLSMAPLVWETLRGFDLKQPVPPSPADLVLAPVRGHAKFANVAAEAAVMQATGAELAQQGGGYAGGPLINAIHTALYPIWVYMKASSMGPPNVFSLRDSLIEKLMNTDIDNVRPRDVRLPFPGIYLSLPVGEKVLLLRHETTGMHEVSLIGVAEGMDPNGERTLYCVFWGEPRPDGQGTQDDNIYSFSFPLPDRGDEHSLRAIMEQADEEQRSYMESLGRAPIGEAHMGTFYGEDFGFFDTLNLMRRLIINLCLYLSSPHPDIEPAKPRAPTWTETVRGEAEPKRSKVRVSRRSSRKGPGYTIWDVGRNVERLQRTSSAADVLVRGHFRNQAHGVGRALRKIIWIEPHIRFKTDEGTPLGHEYDVTPNEAP